MAFRNCALYAGIALAVGVVLPTGIRPAHAGSTAKVLFPNRARIAARLAHTHEIGSRGTTFRIIGRPLTIFDGRGTGTLTAVIGGRFPAADGKGQLVFFWHNNRFNSLSADYETAAVNSLRSPAAGTYTITYARYRASDPLCCPTVRPLKVTYGWSGRLLISNGVPPQFGSPPIRVRYRP